MHNTSLKASNLGKSYDGVSILEEVSLSVSPGVSVSFVSPSGSGKSTLLSMLGLLLTPDKGSIEIDGCPVLGLGERELSTFRRDKVGFIFQHTQLIGSLRALENATMPASFLQKPSFEPRARAQELMESLGLQDRLFHYPYQLSVGQKRRIATARALLLDPAIIIADEPTNDLDPGSAQKVTDTLFGHVRNGGILLYATHDPELANRADTVMRLEGFSFR